jgi:hypothetical protein
MRILSHMGLNVFLSSVTALRPVCSGHDICCELGNMGALCAAMSEVTSPRPRFVTVPPPSIPELLRGQSAQSNNGVEPVQSNPIVQRAKIHFHLRSYTEPSYHASNMT